MEPDPVAPGIRNHRLPAGHLSTLSTGESGPEITRYFWATEFSRRALLIDTLLHAVEQDPGLLGPLPPATATRTILDRARTARPAEIAALLTHPQVGSWAAYSLRRYRGGATADVPLWTDLGGVHALALVVAARAGLTWQTRLPVRGGNVMLPTLGMARFARSTVDCTVLGRTEAGRIWLSGVDGELAVPASVVDIPVTDGPGWWALRQIRLADDLPLTVCLDDLDPFRDLADPVPPARLDDAAFDRWRNLLADAWALLCRDHRADAAALAEGLVSLVPLPSGPGWETRSASNGEAFGSVLVSQPVDPATLAVSLVHEHQHIALGALLHLIRLTEDDDSSRHHAPWRDDPRPLPGLLQGVYAFIGIARFFRRRREATTGGDATLATFEYAYTRAQTMEAMETVLSTTALTDTGRTFVEGLRHQVASWQGDPVDPAILRLAALAADSHRIGWRIRHWHAPDPEAARLAEAWLTDEPFHLPQSVLRPHPELRWEQRIPAIVRKHARAVGECDAPSVSSRGDSLTRAEAALVAGDGPQAHAGFLTSIAAIAGSSGPVSHEEARSWTGLAIHAEVQGLPGAPALTTRPELVRAVYLGLRAAGKDADPLEIAAWLAPALPTGVALRTASGRRHSSPAP